VTKWPKRFRNWLFCLLQGKDCFGNTLHFKISLLPYEGNDGWVEETLFAIKTCLMNYDLPEPFQSCDYCVYYKAVTGHIAKNKQDNVD
jgi:hypothetical protein